MASVTKQKGRNVWQMEFKDQHGIIRKGVSSGCRDKKVAKALAEKIEKDAARIHAGERPENTDVTGPFLGLASSDDRRRPLADLVEEYRDELIRRGSPADGGHISESKRILRAIFATTGWTCLAQVRPDQFSRYLAELTKAGKAPRTQHGHQAKLNAFLNWCCQQGWLAGNPIEHVVPVKVGEKGRRRLRRAFIPDEFQRLLAAATLESHQTAYRVAAYSGFRRKELRLLQRRDCNPEGERPRWCVRPEITKNGRGVELPMLPDCAAALLEHWRQLPHADSPLLTVPMIKTFRRHRRNAGILAQDERDRWADFHSLRYSFCTWMSERHPIEVVQRLMRHSTIKLTADLYKDLGLEDIGKTVWALPPLGAETAKTRAGKVA